MKHAIVAAFDESIRVKQAFLRDNLDILAKAIDAVVAAFKSGNKLLLFGNGGSAADAQHIAAEFVNRFRVERPPLAAIALTTDSSALTSIANDYDYSLVFAKQIQALGKPGDVAIAISTSGNSANVIAALEVCMQLQIRTIGLTGGSGGRMTGKVDHLLNVGASNDTARIQESHILIGHVICELVDAALYPAE
ncbi:MAG: D-sedoheptulose-7-phosphate isomerase [Candidatus Binatia bacterium]